jgi:hypothetical protein
MEIQTNTNRLEYVERLYKKGFTDVYYNSTRVAILNGYSAPLQWVAPNGFNLPLPLIEELEEKGKNLKFI